MRGDRVDLAILGVAAGVALARMPWLRGSHEPHYLLPLHSFGTCDFVELQLIILHINSSFRDIWF